jgi:hypothetical protein
MKPVSLVAIASHLPETVITNDFFPQAMRPGLMCWRGRPTSSSND